MSYSSTGHGALGDTAQKEALHHGDISPGDDRPSSRSEITHGLLGYTVGLVLAVLLTAVSFFIAGTNLVWGPSIPIALFVLAVAQIGVHIVFFLHITTGPDNTNNVLALAFGVLIVFLVIGGSIWIMAHMNANMAMPLNQVMQPAQGNQMPTMRMP
jgi:cytochrome o ubiquinol oxidase subunit IV